MIKKILLLTYQDVCRSIKDVWLNKIISSRLVPRILRVVLYKITGMKIKAVNLYPGIKIKSNKLVVGKGTFINNQVYIDNENWVKIGKNCSIAMQVTFCTSSHEIGGPDQRASLHTVSKPITVGDGTWIGAKCLILPGVNIGYGCVIAAGSIVIQDCEPNGLYAGVPAKRKKDLFID